MLDVLTVRLEAHNDGLNRHRSYTVSVGRDLFQCWSVNIRAGRVGTDGRRISYSAEDEAGARRIVLERLSRRLSAPKRIGATYKVVSIASCPEIQVTNWVPTALQS